MFTMSRAAKATVAACAALAASSVFAHAKLVSSTPADKSVGAAPAKIELHFSEALVPQFSGANLVMTAMPGMADHGAMKVTAKVSGGDDGKTMVITPAQPLVPGAYRVDWRAVASDTHAVSGNVSFEVK
ncbi:copper homeostasis periplasmic binding protein CopC [Ralstonia solanacearum]|uniref:copper homeostasis periplasmic binding protein CopC n=1 Tax=Ralstonia solanacearum TaxID=305 RepID=UPI0001D96D25|nr:copper homeostasis periplasmic binding protein CopC [Ralstonia solanacearum]CBJ34879.1 CopC Copper resistance protein precursor, ''E set domains'' superfamily [Ralstonia solanacearum PSI07]